MLIYFPRGSARRCMSLVLIYVAYCASFLALWAFGGLKAAFLFLRELVGPLVLVAQNTPTEQFVQDSFLSFAIFSSGLLIFMVTFQDPGVRQRLEDLKVIPRSEWMQFIEMYSVRESLVVLIGNIAVCWAHLTAEASQGEVSWVVICVAYTTAFQISCLMTAILFGYPLAVACVAILGLWSPLLDSCAGVLITGGTLFVYQAIAFSTLDSQECRAVT